MSYFTVIVHTVKTTWSGKVKRVKVHESRHETPEAMLAEASRWDMRDAQGFRIYGVVTHEPEFWEDVRPPREDQSIDWSKTDTEDMPF